MAPPSPDHWTFLKDTEFQAWVSGLEEEREKTRKEPETEKSEGQEETSETPPGGSATGVRSDSKDEEITEIPQDEVGNDVMEVDGDGTLGTPHVCTRPLRTLMSRAGLATSGMPQSNIDLDRTEIVLNGDTDFDETSLPPSITRTIKALLEHLHALHLQALFEMGSIRVVDRVSAEQPMASFACVNLLMGEDLNKSLRSLVDITKGACSDLLMDIRTALGPTMFNMAEANINQAVEKYHQRIDSSLMQTLVYLDCTRRDACTFLRAANRKSNEEFKEMVTALSERLSNHARQVWDVVLSPNMNDPRVGLRVNAALSAIQPMVANYFGGVLEGLIESLSLSPSSGEGPAQSTQEGVERRVAVALQRQSSQEGGVKLQGLHVDYSHDFATRDVGISIPALSSTAVPNLLETMDRLRSNLPPVPAKPRAILKEEALFKKLLQVKAASKGENAEVYQLSQVLTQLCEELKLEAEKGKPIETPPTPPGDTTPPLLPDPIPENPSRPKSPNLDPVVKLQRTKLGAVKGVTKPSSLPNPASKNKAQPLAPPEPEDSLAPAFSMEVDSNVDSGIVADADTSKEETEPRTQRVVNGRGTNEPLQGPTPKKQKPGRFLEGVTVKHGPNASVTFFCKVSTNKDDFNRTQSLSDEEEEASGGEGDPQKVTSAPFTSRR